MNQSQKSIWRSEDFSTATNFFFNKIFCSLKYIFYQSNIGIKMDWWWCTLGFSNNGKCKKFLNGKPGFNAKDVVAKIDWYYLGIFFYSLFFAYHYFRNKKVYTWWKWVIKCFKNVHIFGIITSWCCFISPPNKCPKIQNIVNF